MMYDIKKRYSRLNCKKKTNSSIQLCDQNGIRLIIFNAFEFWKFWDILEQFERVSAIWGGIWAIREYRATLGCWGYLNIHSLRNWIMIWSPKQLQSCLKSDNWFGLLFRKFHEFFERFKSLLVIYKFIFNYYTNRLWSGHLNIRKSQWCKLKSSKSCFKVASVVLDPEFLTAFFEIR